MKKTAEIIGGVLADLEVAIDGLYPMEDSLSELQARVANAIVNVDASYEYIEWPESQQLIEWLEENEKEYVIEEQNSCFVLKTDYIEYMIQRFIDEQED